ncbi:MAG TPA: alkaline phosphatase family protein [Ktedonobacteraceae bacterium]|nr:alkaline phosphatase family protein [Ktedonobacteraceae bacterium]
MNDKRRSTHLVTRVGISSIVMLALMALMSPSVFAQRANDDSSLAPFKHVFVIMMENTSFSSLIGNPNAPWINRAAKTYGFATNYTGVTHPSQPNYIASTSGSTNGVTGDSTVTIDVPNIVDQLEAHGKTWKAYMQSIFANGNTNKLADSAGNQLYERKHNPFVSYLDVQTNPERMQNVVGLERFYDDLANNTVPDYSWISPDQCHDMHGRAGATTADPCDFSQVQSLIATGDAFLKSTVNRIMSSRAWTGNSAIFITWDESDFPFGDTSGCCDAVPGGGHVVTLVISHSEDEHITSNRPYNHYSMLVTIERAWKLGCLGFTCDTTNVKPMRDLVEDND